MAIRLRISKHSDDALRLEAVAGIDHFGFGTFLLNIKPEEIEIDQFSKDVLLKSRHRPGLEGMEIWEDYRIAWGSPSHYIRMPISEISKDNGANEWIKEIKTIDDGKTDTSTGKEAR